jgi:hypothetical protein
VLVIAGESPVAKENMEVNLYHLGETVTMMLILLRFGGAMVGVRLYWKKGGREGRLLY